MFFPPNFPLYKAAMDAYSSNSKPAPNFDFENNQGFKDAMSEAFAKAMADKSNQAVRQRDKARGRLQRCTDRFVAERDAKEVALNATADAEDARADADRARVGAEARLAEAERRLASCNERLQHNIALLREESTKRDDVMRVSMEVQNLATEHEREVQQPNASFDQTRRLINRIRDMVAGMDLGFVSNLVGNVLNSIEGNIRMKEQCSRDIADLQRRLDEQLAAIQRDLDSRTAELDREREEHGQCKTNLRELTSRLTVVQADLTMKSALHDSAVAELVQVKTERDQRVARLREFLRQVKEQRDRYMHSLEASQAKVSQAVEIDRRIRLVFSCYLREASEDALTFRDTLAEIKSVEEFVIGLGRVASSPTNSILRLFKAIIKCLEAKLEQKKKHVVDLAEMRETEVSLEEKLRGVEDALRQNALEMEREKSESARLTSELTECRDALKTKSAELAAEQEAKLEVQLELAKLQGEHLEHLTSSQEKTNDFERRLGAMGSDLTNARRERDVATKGMNDAQTRLATCREQLRAATATLEEGRRIIVKIQELASAYSREAQRPNARFARVYTLMTELQAMVSASPDTGGAVPSLAQSMLQYMQTSIDSQKDCSVQLEQTKNDLNAEIKTLERKLKSMEGKFNREKKARDDCQEKLEAAEKLAAERLQALGEKDVALVAETEAKQKLAEDLTRVRGEKAELQVQFDADTKKLAEAVGELVKLTEKHAAATSERDRLREDLVGATNDNTALTETVQQLQTTAAELGARQQQSEADLVAERAQLAQAEEIASAVVELVHAYRNRPVPHEDVLALTHTLVGEIRRRVVDARLSSGVRAVLEVVEDLLRRLRNCLEASEDDKAELKREMDEMEKALQEALEAERANASKQADKMEELAAALDECEAKLNETKNSLQVAEKEIDSLNNASREKETQLEQFRGELRNCRQALTEAQHALDRETTLRTRLGDIAVSTGDLVQTFNREHVESEVRGAPSFGDTESRLGQMQTTVDQMDATIGDDAVTREILHLVRRMITLVGEHITLKKHSGEELHASLRNLQELQDEFINNLKDKDEELRRLRYDLDTARELLRKCHEERDEARGRMRDKTSLEEIEEAVNKRMDAELDSLTNTRSAEAKETGDNAAPAEAKEARDPNTPRARSVNPRDMFSTPPRAVETDDDLEYIATVHEHARNTTTVPMEDMNMFTVLTDSMSGDETERVEQLGMLLYDELLFQSPRSGIEGNRTFTHEGITYDLMSTEAFQKFLKIRRVLVRREAWRSPYFENSAPNTMLYLRIARETGLTVTDEHGTQIELVAPIESNAAPAEATPPARSIIPRDMFSTPIGAGESTDDREYIATVHEHARKTTTVPEEDMNMFNVLTASMSGNETERVGQLGMLLNHRLHMQSPSTTVVNSSNDYRWFKHEGTVYDLTKTGAFQRYLRIRWVLVRNKSTKHLYFGDKKVNAYLFLRVARGTPLDGLLVAPMQSNAAPAGAKAAEPTVRRSTRESKPPEKYVPGGNFDFSSLFIWL